MNELGVLSAFIPEFEPIVAMMQFNMYHHYTVDEHTIQCISQLAQIERGELVEDLPVSSTIFKEGINRKVLYVALLLHDIGKGRDEDHSILGAQITRKVAPRLGLKLKEVDTAEWLVRYHLLMSDMAQKRDIADPRTVRDFAKAVQTRERLDLLTDADGLRYPRRGPGDVEQLESLAACARFTARHAARWKAGLRRSIANSAGRTPNATCARRWKAGMPRTSRPRLPGITRPTGKVCM